ncbi:TPA: hypothetical protein NO409_001833 [Salmonella enterica]|nr:hypothetical protein [Salmonella enterica subsp. enterica serovar Typhimurium]EEE3935367.1 hypothetical protein [Salmonella enterica subsp. enterica serovar Infantis]EHN5199522.1 hypothetical protein [Salmonella enterica subsp. enterica serovar Minnesota]HBK1079416.1 hypothetical protein [Salmonella enterica]EHW4540918.1 hypothetical protein [Salmonella enterica subsp. enterica serovar Minnesota]
MKKFLWAILFLTPLAANAEESALGQLKQSPAAICKDHAQPDQCKVAVQATMLAVYNITSLDAGCESSSEEVKAKMNNELKAQCAAAKEISDYLKSQNR